MDKDTIPQLIELPFTCDCEHEEIIYWYTRNGESDWVRLHKDIELIHFDVWEPVEFIQPSSGLKKEIPLPERDHDRAALKAYVDIAKGKRVCDGKISVTVSLQGYPKGVKVIMGKSAYQYELQVWKDDTGREW
jgi:hypothetical protein